MGDRTYSFDVNLQLSDNAAAYTASGFLQVGGANKTLDFGGNQTTTPKQQARIDAVLVVDVTAIDVASGDEEYQLLIEGSNDSAFGAGTVEVLAAYVFGKTAHRIGTNIMDSIAGRYEIPFCTETPNGKFQNVRGELVISGTTPSISLSAFVAPLMDE